MTMQYDAWHMAKQAIWNGNFTCLDGERGVDEAHRLSQHYKGSQLISHDDDAYTIGCVDQDQLDWMARNSGSRIAERALIGVTGKSAEVVFVLMEA